MTTNGSRTGSALVGAVVALGLWHLVAGPPRASAQQAGGQEMFAVVAAGQVQGHNVLFLIDPQVGRLAVYEHRAGGRLELMAVRDITHEVQFQEWSTPNNAARAQQPSVGDIKKELRAQQQGARGGG